MGQGIVRMRGDCDHLDWAGITYCTGCITDCMAGWWTGIERSRLVAEVVVAVLVDECSLVVLQQ